MDIGPAELLIILLIVILIFGPGRLIGLGGELGRGIRDFRKGLQGDEKKEEDSAPVEKDPPPDDQKKEEDPAPVEKDPPPD